ncbi:MAG: hypothetical protein KGS44_07160 [Alphaproteobacteria bacterium]|jgi:hypothetical protein|nr:hypothetical protein [Alphaproteobacteria bacterium]
MAVRSADTLDKPSLALQALYDRRRRLFTAINAPHRILIAQSPSSGATPNRAA